MNPVHSSLLLPLELPGHFHAIGESSRRQTKSTLHCSESQRQVQECSREKWGACVESATELEYSPAGLSCGISRSPRTRLLHQSVVKSHELGIVVVFQNQQTGANLRAFTEMDFCT